MMQNPYISVVMPVYNKAPHLKRSIKSVFNQTIKEFEFIIINDASTDDSVSEINKFDDSRIRLFHRSKPGPGGYAARNLGIKKAQTELIAFLDADDEWYDNHLECLLDISKNFPEVYLFSSGWLNIYEDSSVVSSYYQRNYLYGNQIINLKQYLISCLNNNSPIWTSVACINKSSPIATGLFPDKYLAKRGGDLHAWLKLLCFHKEIAWSNHLGAIYHRNSVNMTTKTAPRSPELYSKEVYHHLTSKLRDDEQLLIRKYFNKKLLEGWLGNIYRSHGNFKLHKYLYWKGNIFVALTLTLISVTPYAIIRTIRNCWHLYKKR